MQSRYTISNKRRTVQVVRVRHLTVGKDTDGFGSMRVFLQSVIDRRDKTVRTQERLGGKTCIV